MKVDIPEEEIMMFEHEVLSEREYMRYSGHYEKEGKRNDWVEEMLGTGMKVFHYEDGVDIFYCLWHHEFLFVKYPNGYIVFPTYHASAEFADEVTKACGMDVMTREAKIMNGECGLAKQE